jgi:hypothetical protein
MLVHRSRHFRIFLDNPAVCRTVHVAGDGSGIAWDNGLDYGAHTLKTMADEQRPLTGTDRVEFEQAFDLSTAETASVLGVAGRMLRSYRRPTASGCGDEPSRALGKQYQACPAREARRPSQARTTGNRRVKGIMMTITDLVGPRGGSHQQDMSHLI